MPTTVRPRLAALDIEARPPCAGVMGTTLTDNIHHGIQSMPTAILRRLAALEIKNRVPRARVM